MSQRLERIMKEALGQVVERADLGQVSLRTAAYVVAVERVAEAMRVRGIYP